MTATTRRRRILIQVDNQLRDLPGHAWLKHLLEKRYGHTARLVTRNADLEHVLRFGPDLVVLFHANRPKWVRYTRRLRELGVSVAVIPSEGQFTSERFVSFSAGRYTDLANVDLYFVWNQREKDLLASGSTLPEQRIHVVGVPRLDFYLHPRLRRGFPREPFLMRWGFDPSAPLVTWATTFGVAQFEERHEADHLIRQYLDNGLIQSSDDEKFFRDLFRANLANREICLANVLAVAAEYPSANFLIKTHPFEDRKHYERAVAAAGLPNVGVVDRDYIWPVLFASDLHLHQTCMTATEAWVLRKPTLFLDFVGGDWQVPEFRAECEVTAQFETLRDRVGYYLKGGVVPTVVQASRWRYLSKEYHRMDGHATESVAECMDRFLKGKTNSMTLGSRIRYRIRESARRAVGPAWRLLLARSLPSGPPAPTGLTWMEHRRLSEAEEERWLTLIRRCEAGETGDGAPD